MVQAGSVAAGAQGVAKRGGLGVDQHGLLRRKGTPTRPWSKKKSAGDQAIGRSRGGPTTKIHLICDGKGRPLNFRLSGGNVHDAAEADALLTEAPGHGERTIADKGYDSNEIRELILNLGSDPVIPFKRNRVLKGTLKRRFYKMRHQVENTFCDLKQYRAIATRYDKLALNFAGFVALASSILWLKN
jgi:transposase